MIKVMNKNILICALLFSVIACDDVENKEKDVTTQDVAKEMDDVVETVQEYSLEEKQEMIKGIKTRRDNTKARIDEMRKRLVSMKSKTRNNLEIKIQELEEQQQSLEEKITELETSSEAAYNDLKKGVDKAISEIEASIDEAEEEFNNEKS